MKKLIAGLLLLPVVIIAVLVTAYVAGGLREQKTIEEMAAANPGRFVQTRDAHVFLQDAGPAEGHVVVLLHGMGARSELWRATIDALAAHGFRVLAIDIPPFGFSQKLPGVESYTTQKQAGRIGDVLSALHIKNASLVCHSIGCRVGVEVLLQNPTLFESAVVVDPVLGFAPDKTNPHFQQNAPGSLVKALLSPTPVRDAILRIYGVNPLSIKLIFRQFVYDDSCVTDETALMLKQPMFIHGMTQAFGDWLENLMVEPDHALYTDFRNYKIVSLPILVVWGREDTTTPLWQGEALEQMFPHAKLSIMENAGHMPYIEKPAVFNEILLQFLQKKQ